MSLSSFSARTLTSLQAGLAGPIHQFARLERVAVWRQHNHGATGPIYDVAATTLSYHFRDMPLGLDLIWKHRPKRSIFRFSTSRKRRCMKSATSFPSNQTAIRPSFFPGPPAVPGVFALTMNS